MKAFIFDFDGVIVDSERYWNELEHAAYMKMAPGLAHDQTEYMGMSADDIYHWLKQKFTLRVTKDLYDKKIDEVAVEVYKKSSIITGFLPFLSEVQKYTQLIAIGTSSNKNWIVDALKTYNLDKEFSTIVTAQDVALGKSKPDPAIYLEAAKQLQIAPSECIVLEDSKNGVQAGLKANMYTIGLTYLNHGQDVSAANLVVKNFADIPLEKLFTL